MVAPADVVGGGPALGYEDLNDHDTLRQSKLWSLLCGAAGRGRRRASWEALPPGKSTLNRMELTGPAMDAGERYKKIVADTCTGPVYSSGRCPHYFGGS